MSRDSRHDILFEPVQIGPKHLRNRFYQAPHCTSYGSDLPGAQAYLRAMKAEGGWAAVNTEFCSVHPSSDSLPLVSARLWDDADIERLSLTADLAHEHDALAGVELWHGGCVVGNLESRLPARSVSQMTDESLYSSSCYRARQGGHPRDPGLVRRRRAARRSGRVRHHQRPRGGVRRDHPALPDGEVQPAHRRVRGLDRQPGAVLGRDHRTRARGGRRSRPRSRLACAWTPSTTARSGSGRPRRPTGSSSSPTPSWTSGTCRPAAGWRPSGPATTSSPRASLASSRTATTIAAARTATNKPVAAVGRFTNPDTMAEAVRSGVIDIIAAARPSIADPFLPRKIEEGRYDEIRECIGCNVCASRFPQAAPIICTQNATLGEEFRRGWHPERFDAGRRTPTAMCWSSAPGRPAWSARWSSASEGCAGSTSSTQNAEIGGCMRHDQRLPEPRRVGPADQLPPDPARQAGERRTDPEYATRGRGRAHLRGRDRRHRDRFALER